MTRLMKRRFWEEGRKLSRAGEKWKRRVADWSREEKGYGEVLHNAILRLLDRAPSQGK